MNNKKYFWGIVFVILAVLLILKGMNLDIFGGVFGLVSLWEGVWTAILIVILIDGVTKKNWFLITVPIAFILYIFRGKMFVPYIPAWTLFVSAGLLALGLEILFPGSRHHYYKRSFTDENGNIKTEKIEIGSEGVTEQNGTNVETNFGSVIKYFDTDSFESSDLEANFSSIKAYYDKAKMAGSTAVISAEANFGSVEIYIPKNWKLNLNKQQAFGSVVVKGSEEWDGEHTIIVNAEANFGGITITYI